MKFDAKDGRRALAWLGKSVSTRTTIPVLGCVTIMAAGDGVAFRATNLDQDATVTIPCVHSSMESLTVNIKTLAAFMRGAAGDVTIEHNGRVATFESDGMKMTVNLICSPDDMPVMSFNSQTSVEVTEAALHKALTATLFAVSKEKTRYYLNGIYLHANDGHLRTVATDGHRLSMYSTDQLWPFEGAILPRLSIETMLARMKSGGNGMVTVWQDGLKLKFAHPDWTLTAKVIDGTFPDYTRVIPKPADDFNCALSHAQLSRLPAINRGVALYPSEGTIAITSPDGERVSAPMQGKGRQRGFDLVYLKDFTRIFGTVALSGTDIAGDPCIAKAEDPAWLGVIMPRRVE